MILFIIDKCRVNYILNINMNKLQIIDDTPAQAQAAQAQAQAAQAQAQAQAAQAPAPRKPRTKRIINVLDKCYATDDGLIEIGVDEAGRGPMMGRVYTAAVILPKDDSFDHSLMKDSKKFHSEKKIREAAEYIKKHALAWSVSYSTESEIDQHNIRNATHNSMHKSIKGVLHSRDYNKYHLLIDGNDFKPLMLYDDDVGLVQVRHVCIEGGDNKYSAIAAASILAKVSRDTYIEELCKEHPYLDEKYDLLSNKGYGTAKHMAGIREHGISPFHRKTFGLCRHF